MLPCILGDGVSDGGVSLSFALDIHTIGPWLLDDRSLAACRMHCCQPNTHRHQLRANADTYDATGTHTDAHATADSNAYPHSDSYSHANATADAYPTGRAD